MSSAAIVARLKFCGLTRPADAGLAAELGASHLGVIFAGGPRLLTPERAHEVLASVPRGVRRVGVMGDQDARSIAELAARVPLDVVQLHGARTPSELRALRDATAAELWAVVRVADGRLPDHFAELSAAADGVVIDTLVAGALGGTGVATDWEALARSLARVGRPPLLILAGGLRPENVARAVGLIGPDIVDVSSGVERSPGIKEPDRMRDFARNVLHQELSPELT